MSQTPNIVRSASAGSTSNVVHANVVRSSAVTPSAVTPSAVTPSAVTPSQRRAQQLDPTDSTWWRNAVVYQIYPRSFADSNGDGVGDLGGVISKLGYLELLGVDAIWLSPVMRSPMADHGYDVSDPRDIDPLFGDLAELDRLVADAHSRDIRVAMDLVPNHTSVEHPWFAEALAAGRGSAARSRYYFRDGQGPDGSAPPNNWVSVFGGPAWSRITEPDGTPGQWYLHLFAPEQPDVNFDNPEVVADLEQTLRFWLDRGIDGFRIDVAHGLAKAPGLPDMDLDTAIVLRHTDSDPRFNNPQVHPIHRRIRAVVDEYPGAFTVGEEWVDDNAQFAAYLRPDELHLGFNFRLAMAAFTVDEIRGAIDNSLAAVKAVGAPPTWALSNHDVYREVTRYAPDDSPEGIAIGTDRARAMLLVELALPGTAFIYNGAELGLPNVELPDEVLIPVEWVEEKRTRALSSGGVLYVVGPPHVSGSWTLTAQAFTLDPDGLSAPLRYGELASRLGADPGTRVDAVKVREAVLALRRGKGMVSDAADHDTWSAGSFFTNPLLDAAQAATLPEAAPRYPQPDGTVKSSAAWLIEAAGFGKGFGTPPATLSTKHTLAITNRGGAAADDLLRLARQVRDGVRDRFAVTLVPEPVLVGVSLD